MRDGEVRSGIGNEGDWRFGGDIMFIDLLELELLTYMRMRFMFCYIV